MNKTSVISTSAHKWDEKGSFFLPDVYSIKLCVKSVLHTNLSPAQPVSEGKFYILTAPDIHPIIEASKPKEGLLVYHQGTAYERPCTVRLPYSTNSLPFMLWHAHPHISVTKQK